EPGRMHAVVEQDRRVLRCGQPADLLDLERGEGSLRPFSAHAAPGRARGRQLRPAFMLSREVMGALALAILWVNTLLIAAAALKRAAELARLGRGFGAIAKGTV